MTLILYRCFYQAFVLLMALAAIHAALIEEGGELRQDYDYDNDNDNINGSSNFLLLTIVCI